MKKIIAILLTGSMLLFSLPPALSQDMVDSFTLFKPELFFSSGEFSGLSVRQVIMMNDTLYAYLSNSDVYAWSIGEDNTRPFCRLPDLPIVSAISYEELTESVKAQWDEAVNIIASGDSILWGINIFSGKIGSITQDGILWGDLRLDMSLLMRNDYPWPMRVVSAFVESNRLYIYASTDDGEYPQNNYSLLVFDLHDGSCTTANIENAQGVCGYTPENLLLLYPGDEDTWVTKVMSLETSTISNSPFLPFQSPKDKPIGGLSYDASSGLLFFTHNSQVWGGQEGKPYAPMSFIPVPHIVGEASAFALSDGRYALFYGSLYVRSIKVLSSEPDSLYIQGDSTSDIYTSFSRENPDVLVEFDPHIMTSDEIVQALVTGDRTADIYVAFVNHTFTAIVKKGYAADLSSSGILTTNIQLMYPNIQRVLTDQEGRPIAYPRELLMGNWQLNKTLWQRVFGDLPVPATYNDFLDAMLQWEIEYAEKNPQLNFAGDFDHAYWARTIVNAFAQQYGQADSPMVMNSPILSEVLEKLDRVRDTRKAKGQNVHFLQAGGFVPWPDIFNTAGFSNVLMNPIDPGFQLPDAMLDEVEASEGVYIDIPPLVFQTGEQSLIPGKMIVWFVNPYSENKEIATRYLEHAADIQNNTRTYYAIHPDVNAPRLNKGFDVKAVEDMEKRRYELNEDLKIAGTAEERAVIEANINDAESWLAIQTFRKWYISEDAIRHYRSFAPSIRFFEDNVYVTPDGSTMLQNLEPLYQRYAEGILSVGAFLTELDGKMYQMYLEGK